jgi:hypothetical protein
MFSAVEAPDASANTVAAKRRLVSLCVWVALLSAAIEVCSVWLRSYRQVSLEISKGVERALAVRHRGGYTQVVVLGNSLVYEGLSEASLQETMGDRVLIETAGVPGSTYFDWEYGLRALLARGSQPDVVVFGISPSQFLRTPAVTALPVSELWRSEEVYSYYRDWHPNPTIVADLLLEHYSTFFAMRDTFRIYGRKQIYGYPSMVREWGPGGVNTNPAPSPGSMLEATFVKRIAGLQAECGAHARLVLIVVPTRQASDEMDEPALRAAALQLGVPVIEPVGEREWPAPKFQDDGYHLTKSASAELSVLAGEDLLRLLTTPDIAAKRSGRGLQ